MPDTANTQLLLADVDEIVCATVTLMVQHGRFEVHAAANVNDAFRLITPQSFNVLVSDLHTRAMHNPPQRFLPSRYVSLRLLDGRLSGE
jgi:DNA-binding NtrC family response regulator